VPPQRKTPVTAVTLPVVTRDRLNRMAIDMSARLGRRVSMAALVVAALTVAELHPDELAAALAAPAPSGGDPS
jgi:hypothetical protein